MKENTSDSEPFSGIIFRREGVAHLKGTRLSVAQIISTWKQNDCSSVLTAEYLEIPESIIEAAKSYYQQNSAEIDREITQREGATEKWR